MAPFQGRRAAQEEGARRIFSAKDFYTVRAADGHRDLVLEHGLSQLESRYAVLRRDKLDLRLPLSDRDRMTLAAFVAAMFARTKSRQEFIREQWRGPLDLMEKVAEQMRNAPLEERQQLGRLLAPPPGEEKRGIGLNEVRKIVEQPVQSFLAPEIAAVAPMLARMPFAIVDAPASSEFITSDAPCVCSTRSFEGVPRVQCWRAISATIEVSMPLSLRQYVVYGHKIRFSGRYLPLRSEDAVVDQINMRTYAYADENVVASRDFVDPLWL